MDRSIALSLFASAALTPIIVSLWAKITPVASRSEFDCIGAEQLKSRNEWLDRTFTALMFVGLVAPIPFIANVGATRTSLVTYISPVIAVILGAIFLNEHLQWTTVAGLVLIIAGVGLVTNVQLGAARLQNVAPEKASP